MALSLAEFMGKVSAVIIAHETMHATKFNEYRKRELEALPAELAAQEKTLAELQSAVEQAQQSLQNAERAGLDGIKDPFEVLKTWAERHGVWKGWEGEVTSPRNLPPLGWVKRVRNLSLPYFSQYAQMYALAKKGKKEVFKIYLEDLTHKFEKAQENFKKARQSYEFYKEKYESLQAQVQNFPQELEQLREELTPQDQEALEDILEDVWENEDKRKEILSLLPSESYEFEEEVQFTSVIRNHTIHLSDAVLKFETYV